MKDTQSRVFQYDELIDRGILRINQHDYVGAQADFELAVHVNPARYEGYFNLGSLFQLKGAHQQAIEQYSTGILQNVSHPASWYSRALSYAALNQFREAGEDYNRCLELEEDFVTAYMGRGAVNMRLGLYEEAVSDFDVFLAIASDELDSLKEQVSHWKTQILEIQKQSSEERVGELLDLAFEALEAKDHLQAIAYYSEILLLNPKQPVALANRSQMYLAEGDFRQALLDIHQAISLDPMAAVLYANRGYIYQQMGDRSAAKLDFEKALEIDPEQIEAIGYKAILLAEQEPEQSLGELSRAIKMAPDFVEALIVRGRLYFQQKNYALAVNDFVWVQELAPDAKPIYDYLDKINAVYDERVKAQPTNPTPYVARAHFFTQIGKEEEALADWNHAIRLDPQNAISLNGRGLTYREVGNLPYALSDLNKALEISQEHADFYHNRAIVLAELLRMEEAIQDLTIAIKLDPDKSEFQFLHGNFSRMVSDFETAVISLSRAIELGREDDLVFYERAVSYLSVGNAEAAAADYIRAVEFNPDHEWCYDCGTVLAWLHRYEEAIMYLNMAIDVDPSYRDALLERSYAYRMLEDYIAALKDITLALELDPRDGETWLLRAELYALLNQWEFVMLDASKVLIREPGSRGAFVLRAQAYEELARLEEALKDIKTLIKYYPKNPDREKWEEKKQFLTQSIRRHQ